MPSASSRPCASAMPPRPRPNLCPVLTTPTSGATRFPCPVPEIGQTLREARMRARIDISELESETKIRAKYLRALENEEWDLLPGPTYVKSFLRTYAEALGLDGRLLVEEFKLRYERLSDAELQPSSLRSRRERARRRQRKAPGAKRDIAVAVVVLLMLRCQLALVRVG